MKDTVIKELINITKINLDSIAPKVIYNINEKYYLKKEQKEKEKFALEFVKWCKKLEYNIYYDTKYKIKCFRKDKGYI